MERDYLPPILDGESEEVATLTMVELWVVRAAGEREIVVEIVY
jgi:hypothetical protein